MILNTKQYNKPPQLVVIETSTMRMTHYNGKIKGDSVIMNLNETPLKYVKRSNSEFPSQ